ncbi:hypothetical protein GCM10022248_39640 [Nonomuraea soli]
MAISISLFVSNMPEQVPATLARDHAFPQTLPGLVTLFLNQSVRACPVGVVRAVGVGVFERDQDRRGESGEPSDSVRISRLSVIRTCPTRSGSGHGLQDRGTTQLFVALSSVWRNDVESGPAPAEPGRI